MSEQLDIRDYLGDAADKDTHATRWRKVAEMVRHLHGRGLTTKEASKITRNRITVESLKRYSRELLLSWPDYTPRKMRDSR